jgi:hypothetical protein
MPNYPHVPGKLKRRLPDPAKIFDREFADNHRRSPLSCPPRRRSEHAAERLSWAVPAFTDSPFVVITLAI